MNLKILISGAGIAGLTLAYWLKQYGFTPTIVEKHPYPPKGGYKVDVRGAALEVAKRMGIYQILQKENVNLQRATFVTADLKKFEFEGDLLGACSEEDIEVNRYDLCQILLKAIGEVEILYNESITQIDEKVHFEKLQPRPFDLIIGADGLYSQVRRLVFGDDSYFLMDQGVRFCVFPIANIFGLHRAEIVYFNKNKFFAAYAVNHHSYASFAFKTPEVLKKPTKEDFAAHFKDCPWEIPRLVQAMQESDECYLSASTQTHMPTWSKGNVALVGDAAYAAQGIGTSLAIVGAYVLARERVSNYMNSHAFGQRESSRD